MCAARELLPQLAGVPVARREVPQKRKRAPKASVACDTCRRLKSKCDQNIPCNMCKANSEECVYRSKPPPAKSARTASPTRNEAELAPERREGPPPLGPNLLRSNNAIAPSSFVPASSTDGTLSHAEPQRRDHDVVLTNAEGAPKAMPVTNSAGQYPEQPADDTSSEDETSPQGFGETNSRTNGKEFYGPAATLAFLMELRSRAAAVRRKLRPIKTQRKTRRTQSRLSLVNIMDGEEEEDVPDQDGSNLQGNAIIESPHSHRTFSSPNYQFLAPFTISNRDVEKQCIDLYFSNLHHIYYFLNKASFMGRCSTEIWADTGSDSGGHNHHRYKGSKFPAVYNAVVALGALTAGESLVLDTETDSTVSFWAQLLKICTEGASTSVTQAQLPRELAKIYFNRAKALLDDFFEACTLETQQALFLMSIFCTYALKPHSSYMYHGMAVRTAMAMGSSNLPDTRKNPIEGIRTWWLMYSHEMELCSLLGRETCLQDAEHYPVFLAKFGDAMPPQMGSDRDENLFFARCNTELARILKQISESIYHTGSITNKPNQPADRLKAASDLNDRLMLWKASLKPTFDLDLDSLTESEIVTKRKIILQLRLSSALIGLHRPFLVSAANQHLKTNAYEANVRACLGAAQKTIQHLYDTFRYRPFFRTWWYATSYAFNASSIILYSLVTGLHEDDASLLLGDVEKALNIFQAMDGITVARRCARLTREMLQVAELAARGDAAGSGPSSMIADQIEQIPPRNADILNTAAPVAGQRFSFPVQVPAADMGFSDHSYGGGDVGVGGNNSNASFGASMFSTDDDDFFRSMMDVTLLDSFGANVSSGMDFSFGTENYDANAFYGGFAL